MKPKLLFISGTFAARSGGAEISALSLLRLLQQKWQVFVLTCSFDETTQSGYREGMQVRRVPYARLRSEGERMVRTLSPQLIYTVMLGSDCAMQLGQEFGIPTIVNICKVPCGPRYLKTHPPTKVLAVSNYVHDYLCSAHSIESIVLNPVVYLEAPPLPPKPRFITIFNPVEAKGGHLFRSLAASLPEKEFAWVPGWDILRGQTGEFDVEICEAVCCCIDLPFRGRTPADVPMDLPNITRLEPIFPPHTIFQETRILVVPSRWDEAFGRVAVEAMLFDVPVVGSAVGGLAEIVREGGSALPKDDLTAWVSEMRALDVPDYYQELQSRGRAFRARWLSRDDQAILRVFGEFG